MQPTFPSACRVFALIFTFAAAAWAATLPVSEDSSSSRGQLTTATNKAATLRVDATHNGYIYFNLADISANTAAQIRYARLRLFFPKVTASGGGLEIHVVTSPWDEAVPTAEPSRDSAMVGAIPSLSLAGKRFASVDVTAAVRAWVAGSVANEGFAIVGVNGTRVLIGAKEGSGTGYPAELDVELNPDAGSISSALLASDLTLSGTTTGTFSGNGAGLLSLNAANVTGQLSNAQLANSGLALNLGAGLSGDGTVALGGTLNLSNSGVLSLAGGGGVTVSTTNGNITLGSTATSANTPGSIVTRDASGDFAAGTVTAVRYQGAGALPWQSISGTTQTASANTGYLATNGALVTITLPASPALGDLVRVSGVGVGGWKIVPTAGQSITGFAAGDGPVGGQGASGAVQYVAANQWQTLSESQIAAGTISSAQLATNAVQTTNIASGAVGNAQLANPSLTVSAGNGLGGGGMVSLGGTVTLSNSGVTSLSDGGGITVSGSTGAITLGSTATSANTAGSLVARDASGNFAAGTVTAAGNLSLPVTASSSAGVITQDGVRLIHTFGTNNFFAGAGAGNFIVTGNGNTAVGSNALASNIGGSSNTAIGWGALSSNTSGFNNDASGHDALFSNTTGYNNVASGLSALSGNTTGIENTAVSVNAMQLNQTGGSNTAVGLNALQSNTTGSNNIALGFGAGSALTTGSNNIAIGNGGVAGESNTIRLGSGTHTQTLLLGGDVGIGRTPSGFKLDVNGGVRCVGAVNTSSDARFKLDIQPLDGALAKITKMRGVSYEWNRAAFPDKGFSDGRQIGFIAQEIAPIVPEVVTEDGQGFFSVAYSALVPVLVEAVKEQQQTISELEQRLAAVEALVRAQAAASGSGTPAASVRRAER